MKKLNIDELKTIVVAVLLMIIGILFCCSLAIGIDGLSVVMGLVLLVIGIIFLFNSVIANKTVLNVDGMIGVVLLALGIMFISSKLAGLIFVYIPFFLIVLGCAIIIDGLLGKFITKSDSMMTFVLKIVIGVVSIALGLCLRLIDGFAEYASVVLGVVMIVYALYMVINVFMGGKNKSVL